MQRMNPYANLWSLLSYCDLSSVVVSSSVILFILLPSCLQPICIFHPLVRKTGTSLRSTPKLSLNLTLFLFAD